MHLKVKTVLISLTLCFMEGSYAIGNTSGPILPPGYLYNTPLHPLTHISHPVLAPSHHEKPSREYLHPTSHLNLLSAAHVEHLKALLDEGKKGKIESHHRPNTFLPRKSRGIRLDYEGSARN